MLSKQGFARFTRACGPAAVASALGVSREEAAREIVKHKQDGRRYVATTLDVLAKALDSEVYYRTEYLTGGDKASKCPTLAQFLRTHQGNDIVLASRHFMHVQDGEVVEDNGLRPMRGRVIATIPVPVQEEPPVPEEEESPQVIFPTTTPRATRTYRTALNRLVSALKDVTVESSTMTVRGHEFRGSSAQLLAQLSVLAREKTSVGGYGLSADQVRMITRLTKLPSRGLSGWQEAALMRIVEG